MGFYETPVRRLCIVRACGLFVVGTAIGVFSFFEKGETLGRVFCYAGVAFCGLLGLLNLWWARRARPSATVTVISDRASTCAQIRLCQRMLWLSLIAFPVMAIWVVYDLHQLESGVVNSVQIWAPLVPIYTYLGYWPTVLTLPLLGIICCVIFAIKLRKLDRRASTEKADNAPEQADR